MSVIVMANLRWLVAASKLTLQAIDSPMLASAAPIRGASWSAGGVACIPRAVGMNSLSPSFSRSRFNALLTVGCDMPRCSAACETLQSACT
jgi:hypothetical protein